MNLKNYLEYATKILKEANIEAPAFEAGVILCHVLKCNKTFLYSHDAMEIEDSVLMTLDEMINERLKNVPIQYILGEVEFMSLDFLVSRDVLIPRPDTEILVENCIDLLKYKAATNILHKDKAEVLDMCTGSGCIAISIAYYFKDSFVTACDISKNALEIAKKNIKKNRVQDRVTVYCSDLFSIFERENRKFDLIVSNPPYIETQVIQGLQKEVRDYEPLIALDGGNDGLDFYRKIINDSPSYLYPDGVLALEIGYNQAESVYALMAQHFKNIKVYKDLSSNDRVVIGTINHSKV